MKSDTVSRDASSRKPCANHSQSNFIISPFPANLLGEYEHISALSTECAENQFCIKIVAVLVCLLCDLAQRPAYCDCEFNSPRRIKPLKLRMTIITGLCLADDNYAARLEYIQKHFCRPERGIVH